MFAFQQVAYQHDQDMVNKCCNDTAENSLFCTVVKEFCRCRNMTNWPVLLDTPVLTRLMHYIRLSVYLLAVCVFLHIECNYWTFRCFFASVTLCVASVFMFINVKKLNSLKQCLTATRPTSHN